jgi:hypothetical protein
MRDRTHAVSGCGSDFRKTKSTHLRFWVGIATNNVTLQGQKIVDLTHHHDCDMSRNGMWQKMILPKQIGEVLETQRIHGSVFFVLISPRCSAIFVFPQTGGVQYNFAIL